MTLAGWLTAAAPTPPKVSDFAPVEDVLGQVDYYLNRLEAALADEADYSQGIKNRVKKDSNTLVVLLLVIGLHDQDSKLRAVAPTLLPLTQKLAASAEDYSQAKPAFDELHAITEQGATGGQPLKWEKVAELGQLMKQVPTINNRLKRSLRERSFEKDAAKSAGYAAALAAIAQASMADTHEVKNPDDTQKWYDFCTTMRDAAGQINSAVHRQDFDAATAAMERMQTNCDDCHAVFREEDL
jgi:hypothetical protein